METALVVSLILLGLIEVAKRMGLPTKYIYPIALVLGIAVAFLPQAGAFGNTILYGLALGLSSVGLYQGIKKTPLKKLLKSS